MQKAMRLISIGAMLFSTATLAHIRPVTTVSLGSDSATFSKTNTDISFIPPFYNTYVDTNSTDTEWVGGIGLGANIPWNSVWSSQIGVNYYQNSGFQARGDNYQLGNSMNNNLGYQYYISSRRVLLESKLLYTLGTRFHPYVDVGVGEAFNESHDYTELTYTGSATPMGEPFANHTNDSFTYVAGFGVDMDAGKWVRLGIGYRYVDLGKASLGTSPLQADTVTLQKSTLTSNEFLFQISTIC